MTPHHAARLALDPSVILEAQGLAPDPWQRAFLFAEDRSIMLCCCRGAGKSRATSAKALHHALFRPKALVLLLSRSQRQSAELFRYCLDGFRALGRPVPLEAESKTTLEFPNHSRIVCLPGKEETIRSFQGVTLLIKDEAARIPDDLNRSVTPMLAISHGQEIDLSTPWGQRGWFWKKWTNQDDAIKRIRVTWQQCPRHTPEFIAKEQREAGDSWVKQEYECSFEALSGLVYPDFEARCGIDFEGIIDGRKVGGLDFGFRDPFAALWGHYNPFDDVLTLTGERYLRETGLHEHAAALPAGYDWEADPSQPTQIVELRRAGFAVRKAFNKIEPGIAAVRARLERGKLKVVRHRCPNLLEEASLYRYEKAGENPLDEHNHALDALRYLVARIDRGFIAKYLKTRSPGQPADLGDEHPTSAAKLRESAEALHGARLGERRRLLLDVPEAWTSLN